MEKFIINLPNKKVDPKGTYKNYLLNRLSNVYPELSIDGVDGPENEYSYQYIGPKDAVAFGFHPLYNVSKFGCPCSKNYYGLYPFKKDYEEYNIDSEFERAMKKLNDYAKAQQLPRDYDFVFCGMPVREYQSFIQIGNRIIPKINNKTYLHSLPVEQKTIIINVINEINNTIVIND